MWLSKEGDRDCLCCHIAKGSQTFHLLINQFATWAHWCKCTPIKERGTYKALMQSPLMHFILFFLFYLYVTPVCTGKPPEPRNYNWEDTICNRVKIEKLQWVEDISRTGTINISLFWIFLHRTFFLYFFCLLIQTVVWLPFKFPFRPIFWGREWILQLFLFQQSRILQLIPHLLVC